MAENQDRSERLLALILVETMRDSTQKQRAVRLRSAGFSNKEIAELLQTSPQGINQLLYEARKSKAQRQRATKQENTKNHDPAP